VHLDRANVARAGATRDTAGVAAGLQRADDVEMPAILRREPKPNEVVSAATRER